MALFDYFFYTKETIPAGHTTAQFGLFHITSLVCLVLLCIIFCAAYKKTSTKGRRIFLTVITCLLIADELFKHITLACLGLWNYDYLPLHLCSINIIVSTIYTIKPSKLAGEFLYAISLPGAVIALLCPSWFALPVMNFMHLHSWLAHILLMLYPCLLLASGELKPNYKNLPRCALLTLAIAIPLYFINKPLGTNFMFLANPGKGNPLVFFESILGNPGYFLGYILMVALGWFLMYIPWVIIGRKKKIKTL